MEQLTSHVIEYGRDKGQCVKGMVITGFISSDVEVERWKKS